MRTYLKKESFNVTDGEKTYKVKSIETYHGYTWAHVNLENVNDEEDTMQEIFYFLKESLEECLEANGYDIIEE